MRFVMVTLVAGLALINAVGVFGKLVEAHVSVAASSRSSVTERFAALDARVRWLLLMTLHRPSSPTLTAVLRRSTAPSMNRHVAAG